jgi:hypothetical protein
VVGPSWVPGRFALRQRCGTRTHRDSRVAVSRLLPLLAAGDAAGAWQLTGLTLAKSVLDSGPEAATEAALLGQALSPSTIASYQRLWVLFGRFCVSVQRSALPASPATVSAYLGTLFDGGRFRGTSIRPYVAAIGAQHRLLALVDPTSHTLVDLARRGFSAADARRSTGATLRSAAYPAHAALYCLNALLAAASSSELRFWAAVPIGFLICTRPSSLAGLTPETVRLEPAAILVALRVFKCGTSGHTPRLSLYLPTEGASDPIHRLFGRLLADATYQEEPWFSLRDLSAAAAEGMRAFAAVAHPGTRYTPGRYAARVLLPLTRSAFLWNELCAWETMSPRP